MPRKFFRRLNRNRRELEHLIQNCWKLDHFFLTQMNLRRSMRGYVLILVAVLLPVVIAMVQFAVKRVQQSHKTSIKTIATAAVGQAVLERYNPGKTWNQQKAKVYSAAVQALCDRAFELNRDMIMTPSSTPVYYLQKNLTQDISSVLTDHSFNLTKAYTCLSSQGLSSAYFSGYLVSGATLITANSLFCDDFPITDMVFNSSSHQLSFKLYTTSSTNAIESHSTVFADPTATGNTEKLNLALDTTDNCILCDVGCLGREVKAYPARCDVDIVLTLPTNHAACTSNNGNSATATPIVEIARAYQTFLKNNFLHTRGVAVGVVPYSAKISLPPNRTAWTVGIPPMTSGPNPVAAVPNPPYIKQAIAQGTDGQAGGDIAATGILYDWGDANVGCPIMYRCGIVEQYRGVNLYRGSASTTIPTTPTAANSLLLSTADPATAVSGAYPYKFLRMNTNPCYLGHCNLLAGMCERTCPTFMANPYFITELTDDLEKVIYDFSLIRPIDDTHNKSNFLFLAIQWAENLLSGWTSYPSTSAVSDQKCAHPTRGSKKRAVILIVNAPDNFEPQELTYLGFNNDASEIPMFESDTINFAHNYGNPTNSPTTSPVKGTKGALVYTTTSGSVSYNTTSGRYECSETASARLSFPSKGLLKIVVNRRSSSVTFYNDNDVSDCQVDGTAVTLGTAYPLVAATTFTFSGPTKEMWNWTHNSVNLSDNAHTGGVNFGHNLSLYKVKYALSNASISSATLSNQILRGYAHYGYGSNPAPKSIIPNSNHIKTNDSNYWDPCVSMDDRDSFLNADNGWVWGSTSSPQFAQIKAYNFFVACYGLTKNAKFLMTAAGTLDNYDSADPVNPYISMQPISGAWPQITRIVNGNKYNVANLNNSTYTVKNSDRITIFTGRFKYLSSKTYTGKTTSFRCDAFCDCGGTTYKKNICSDPYGNTGEVIFYYNQNNCDNNGDNKCNNQYPYANETGGNRAGYKATTVSGWTASTPVFREWTKDGVGINVTSSGAIDGLRVFFEFSLHCTENYDANGTKTGDCSSYTNSETGNFSSTCGNCCSGGNCNKYDRCGRCNETSNNNTFTFNSTYSNFRYDLNNFFFVNLGTKSYLASATLDQIKKNAYIGTLSNDGSWLAFCGDGELSVTVTPISGEFKFTNINNLSGNLANASIEFGGDASNVFTNNTFYAVNELQTFYILPEQIPNTTDVNGNYYVNFGMTNLVLVSAEITNQPVETIMPTCSLSGTSNALGSSNQSAIITTNVKAPLTVSAKTQTNCSVTFYTDNGVSDCQVDGPAVTLGTAYPLAAATTFTFSGPTKDMWNWVHNMSPNGEMNGRPNTIDLSDNAHTGGVNFGHNLSLYKVKYALSNASISLATLSNQILRCYAHYGHGSSGLKSIIPNSSDHVCSSVTNADAEEYLDPCICPNGNGDHYNRNDGWIWNTSTPQYAQVKSYNFHPACYGVQKVKFLMTAHVLTDYGEKELGVHESGGWKSKEVIVGGNKYNVFNLTNVNSAYSDKVLVCTGRFQYKSKESRTVTSTFRCDAFCECSGDTSIDNECCDSVGNKGKTSFWYPRSVATGIPHHPPPGESNYEFGKNGGKSFYQTGPGWSGSSTFVEWTKDGSSTDGLRVRYTFTCDAYKTYDENGDVTDSNWPENLTYSCTCGNQQCSKDNSIKHNDCGRCNEADWSATTTSQTYSPYRYDLNNFFFVNTETKSYNPNATKDDVIENKCIATLEKESEKWLCFCGDGKLEVRITPTGTVSGTIAHKNASNADASTTVTNYNSQTITIDPATHLYEPQGDGTYKINLRLTNVVVSNPAMVSTTLVLRYKHPNLVDDGVKNVRIVDFNKSVNGKPQSHGAVVFGGDANGSLVSKSYSDYQHLKYWITTGHYNHMYRTDSDTTKNVGDYFMHLMDVDGNIPSIQWFFSSSATGDFGTYADSYSFSGLHRVFFPLGEQEYHSSYGARVNLTSGGKMAFFLGGFTIPINHALQNNGFQATSGTLNSTLSTTPNAAVAAVTAAAYDQLRTDFPAIDTATDTGTRVYVIKYGSGYTTVLDSLDDDDDGVKTYSASSESTLIARLHEIANDIKSFAQYTNARVEETIP
ncbi:MAG: hypothetical protein LBG20_01180 [Holosporaceae bacterium]|jgi:hypothetical protein|nr:hypothetical protein [Holosporaceae bacterium]